MSDTASLPQRVGEGRDVKRHNSSAEIPQREVCRNEETEDGILGSQKGAEEIARWRGQSALRSLIR